MTTTGFCFSTKITQFRHFRIPFIKTIKALHPEVVKLVYFPMIVEKGVPRILGKHLKLDENIPHRVLLSTAMSAD